MWRFINWIKSIFHKPEPKGEPVIDQKPVSDVPTWFLQYNGPLIVKQRDYGIVDLFNYKKEEITHMKNMGIKPIAYFSLHFEEFRPDKKLWQKRWIGGRLGNWRGERKINPKYWREIADAIMIPRIKMARDKGFVGIDPDNLDQSPKHYAKEYWNYLKDYCRENDMLIGQKNCASWSGELDCDFFMTEETFEWNTPEYYVKWGKPIFNIEYKRWAFDQAKKDNRIYSIMKDKMDMGSEEL